MSGANLRLWHDRWRPSRIGLPVDGGVPDHENSVTGVGHARRAGEAPREPLTRTAAGIDTGLRDPETGREAHRRDLL